MGVFPNDGNCTLQVIVRGLHLSIPRGHGSRCLKCAIPDKVQIWTTVLDAMFVGMAILQSNYTPEYKGTRNTSVVSLMDCVVGAQLYKVRVIRPPRVFYTPFKGYGIVTNIVSFVSSTELVVGMYSAFEIVWCSSLLVCSLYHT